MHIQGDCGASEAAWPKLDAYASAQVDRMRLMDHFSAYLHPKAPRNYPVVALNYHKVRAGGAPELRLSLANIVSFPISYGTTCRL